jgi:hypothetical protein
MNNQISIREAVRSYFNPAPVAGRAEGSAAGDSNNKINDQALILLFAKSPENLLAMACVNKKWNAIAKSEPLYKELYSRVANQVFNSQKWMKHFGDPGQEPRIPLPWLLNFNSSKGFLTLVPESVKIAQPDGTVVEEPLTAATMGKWAHSPKEGHKIECISGYTADSVKEAIHKQRPIEKTHWVWLSKEVIGQNESHIQQLVRTLKLGNDSELPRLVDTIVTLFAAHVENGKHYFECDPDHDNLTMLRLWEEIREESMMVGAFKEGLSVFCSEVIDSFVGAVGVRISK